MENPNNNIDVQMAEIMKDISYIKISVDKSNALNTKEHNNLFELVRDMRKEFHEEIKCVVKDSEKKFASKYIEKISLFCLGALVTAVIGYFLKLL